jgi:predicted ATP-dependent serine protease
MITRIPNHLLFRCGVCGCRITARVGNCHECNTQIRLQRKRELSALYPVTPVRT